MIALFALQLLIPLLLVGWIVARPLPSALGLAVQTAGSLVVLAASARAGLWLFPPWWTPWLALALVGLAGALHLARRRRRALWPTRATEWLGMALLATIGAGGTWAAAEVRAALRVPEGASEGAPGEGVPAGSASAEGAAPVALAFPLAGGRYLVVNGGADELVNAHLASTRPELAERMRPWRGNAYAVDLVAIDALGMRASGIAPEDPAAYRIFGTPVLAPCAGEVLLAVDGLPDMRPPEQDRDHMAGNHVLLDCGERVHVLLGHLRSGSVRVRAGDCVEQGAPIGEVGNSGATNEPHLHVHAQRPGPPDAPLGGDPLPMLVDGSWLVRGDRIRVE